MEKFPPPNVEALERVTDLRPLDQPWDNRAPLTEYVGRADFPFDAQHPIRQYWYVLSKRKWTIVACVVLVVSMAKQ